MAKICVKFIVSGLVQGVGFRFHTCHEGNKRGLTGYARNLENGDVEVVACGAQGAIDSLEQWLRLGPRTSSVQHVASQPIEFKAYQSFQILY
ncbi:acylphosphatase [Vibrio sp. TH_r3]|uniref:acylphosphatase n=1 Tax=Vibrio sp. TH_r3 TaxID=3082084 RepID=UPI0029552097|nr:acylphosphatase [Vibrio sp. TH_r3]MDV7104395.1 acylphosphatase [Vibrio sp. TH_r3]